MNTPIPAFSGYCTIVDAEIAQQASTNTIVVTG
jgi:hypothetical protein